MDKLKGLIAYFLDNYTYEPTRTEIVKLIYWFEYIRVQTLGEQLTNVKFIRFNYGPYAKEIIDAIDEMADTGAILVESHKCCNGNISYLHSITNKDKLRGIYKLGYYDTFLANVTIKDLKGLKYEKLIEKVYSTPPMVKILKQEEVFECKFSEEELDMNESVESYKINKERLLEARQRRLQRKEKGSDLEYIKCISHEQQIFEPLTRRVMECQQ